MKVLLTGGAGFIGSWVGEALIADGNEIFIIDDLSTGNIQNIPKDANFVKADIKDRDRLKKVFEDFKPEVVNHHAAQMNVRNSVEDPIFDAQVNILGTINLLELSIQHEIKKFIFASTGGAIYGEPEVIPCIEDTLPAPISPYGISKHAVEQYLNYYKAVHGLSHVVLRYSNVYGPRQNPHGEAGVVAIFCDRIKYGNPCEIFGDGKQTRDYIYVEDVARANILSLNAKDVILNIGTAIETSVIDIVSKLKRVTNRDVQVVYSPRRSGEVDRIALEIKRAEERLGWSPHVNLEDGLSKTWEWFSSKQAG
ncbi:MAG: NAD-dependent epimerase/dehydratase family protein [Thermodesulfobacteriota bacterium]